MKEKINSLVSVEKANKQILQDYLEQQLFLLKNIVDTRNMETTEVVEFLRELDKTNLSVHNMMNRDSWCNWNEGQLVLKSNLKTEKDTDTVLREGIRRYELALSDQPLENKRLEMLPEKGTIVVLGKTDEIDSWNSLHDFNILRIKNDSVEADYALMMEKDIVGIIGIASKNYHEEEAVEFVKSMFLAAKYFSEKVKGSKKKLFFGGITFLGGRLGFENEQDVFVQGAVSGLCKTLALEWSDKAVIRYIDCSLEMSYEDALSALQSEMAYGDRVEVGIDQERRNLIQLVERYEDHAPEAKNQPNMEDVFLVSGGARGVTFACIMRLAEKYHCKFILLGRTKIEKEEAYLCGTVTEDELKKVIYEHFKETGIKITPANLGQEAKRILSMREVSQNINDLKEFASDVIYEVCDVRNADILNQVVRKSEERVGKITGIIHGAGVLADKLVEKKTVEDWEKVFGIKYTGLKNMLSVTNPENIKYITFFSSIAGYFGNMGQVDYSSANEYLNLFAKHWKIKHPECNIVSINWGAWDAGMVSLSLRKAMKDRGVKLIPIDVGTRYFLEVFEKQHDSKMCQIVINYLDRWG